MKLLCKITFLCLGLFLYNPSEAQVSWGGATENQLFNFGFLFHGISSEYKIQKTSSWNQKHYYTFDEANEQGAGADTRTPETYPLAGIYAEPRWGGGIGFLASYNPTSHLSLRLTPAYIFSDRKIRYVFNMDQGQYRYQYDDFDEKGITGTAFKTIKSTAVDFPLDLKVKSDRFGNVGAYFLVGSKYTIDLGARKNLSDRITTGDRLQNTVYTRPNYFSYSTGIGFTYFFDFFKLSAEVKYNQSFNNINITDQNLWSRPIDKIYLRSLNFSLIFE